MVGATWLGIHILHMIGRARVLVLIIFEGYSWKGRTSDITKKIKIEIKDKFFFPKKVEKIEYGENIEKN